MDSNQHPVINPSLFGENGEVLYVQEGYRMFPGEVLNAIILKLNSQMSTAVTPQMYPFDVVADGTDCSFGMQNFLDFVFSSGVNGYIPAGDYALQTGLFTQIQTSTSVMCSPGAKFRALFGFASGQKLFEFTSSNSVDKTMTWIGGGFDGSQMPLPAPGEANDVFSVEGTNAVNTLVVALDWVYTGDNWLSGAGAGLGADSHIFCGGIQNVTLHIGRSQGATDSAIYLSANASGTVGQNATITGNYIGCIDAATVKRTFNNTIIDINCVDCQNGAGVSGFDPLIGGQNVNVRVNALRTERPCHMIAGNTAIVNVVSKDLGVSIPGYTSPTAYALHIAGFTNLSGLVVSNGINPACTPNIDFKAVNAVAVNFTPSPLITSDCQLMVNATGMGQDVFEPGSSRRNFYFIRTNDSLNASVINSSSMSQTFDGTLGEIRWRVGSGTLAEFTATALSFGGGFGGEALQVQRSSTNVNAVRVDGGIAGGSVTIAAVGADTDVDVILAPKGAGKLRFGTLTGLSGETLSGYITFKTSDGATRKLAIVA